ncbi:MAG: S1 RNA-binding domain-containing protein [Bdellovibrionota bacterium]
MSKRDAFGDEVSDKLNKSAATDFASMFEQSLGGIGKKLSTGDSFTGEILSISKEESFISTSTPVDAMILTVELLDENKTLKYKVGDSIEVVVVKTKGGEIRVARKGSKKSNNDLDSLEDAFDMELPVEGRVTEICNGGFRVSVNNKMAFCPVSQMDFKVVDQQSYIDKKFDFIITKLEPRNLVVSRRRLLDQQKVESEGQFLDVAKSGDIYTGRVSRIEKFGAFVTLENGVEGLVHISEIGWSRLADPSEVLHVGQVVTVKLLKSEEIDGRLKISLSIKQAGGDGDPWLMVPQNFPINSLHKGVVEKKEAYGLFVNIAPGVTGLLPKSKWRDSVDHQMYESRKKGDVIQVQIDEILFDQKRISLGVPTEAEDQSWKSVSSKSGFTNSSLGGLADLMNKKK